MDASRPLQAQGSAIALGLALLIAADARAGLYKCRQPDGHMVYQQTACGGRADVDPFEIDIRGPNGSEAGASARDYSIGTQAKQMRTERERLDRSRRSARRQAAAATKRATGQSPKTPDRAKCAKHRAEAAKWKQKVMQGYRKRTEKDYNEGKLEHHQALVDQYCD
ncbi:DUF4124 domain-containing protein [Thiorhodococcus mannitoliphagus]|uniref:DUF4124 domain-containing protein n=1 Tax=Thiorhodococcus mannitoliphagus TaxID=329406 RepID=A0A6P1DWK3_9GAMM|nr:DUF4124 domain-containing protein [Thiorhodococcus mannitoliphagus]NEX20502.1 DUF4124 domain-containing protein [Thiorhodococcus mannitoliphagus]